MKRPVAGPSVAHSLADSLLTRAADVALEEVRPLILPTAPASYRRPKQIQDLVDHPLARVLERLGLSQAVVPEWQGTERRPGAARRG